MHRNFHRELLLAFPILTSVLLLGNRDLEQRGTAPFPNNPVRCFEIGGASDGAEGMQVLGGEEEGIGELVFVDEEIGWQCEVGV